MEMKCQSDIILREIQMRDISHEDLKNGKIYSRFRDGVITVLDDRQNINASSLIQTKFYILEEEQCTSFNKN